MPKTKRQRIVEAIVARMERIRVANAFETNAGERVEQWPVRFDEAELLELESSAALGVYDLVDEVSKDGIHAKGATHRLRVQVRVFRARGVHAQELRAIIGDIVTAIGEDVHWTDEATGQLLAIDTEPQQEGFVVPREALEVAEGAVEFVVVYATAAFDPYQ